MILTLIPFLTFSQSAKKIAKNCLSSTVSLVMEDNFKQPLSIASGFIVDEGKVITNLHVIEGAKYGYVLNNGSTKRHKIEGYFSIDKKNDLAILSVPTIEGKPLQLSSLTPEVGEQIYAIGNPKGLSGTISEGIISGIRNLENTDLIQITAPISPGSSGGPVVDNSGHVIGVAVGTLSAGQNLNFAIPSGLLKSLIDEKVGSVTTLNIAKGTLAPKTDKSESYIKEGVSIRNVKIETTNVVGGNLKSHHKVLKSFSFKNDLPYYVEDIAVLFILYDKHGVPLDYYESVYLDGYKTGIKPFLAKTYQLSSWMDGRDRRRVFRIENEYEKIEIRILDFKISEN